MQLLIVRHAIAEDALEWAARGLPDAERPLTAKGRSLMTLNAAGIAALMPTLDVVATSPFPRAVQTAEILAEEWKSIPVVVAAPLRSGGSREGVLEWLRTRSENQIAIVGHEPDLGRLVGWLLTGADSSSFALRTGGACRVDFDGEPSPGHGALRWFLPPSALRRLAP